MNKSILAITILALTTSGAFAAHHRTHHHHRAMNASPVAGAPPPMMGAPSPVMDGVSSADQATRVKVCANPATIQRTISTRTGP